MTTATGGTTIWKKWLLDKETNILFS